MISARALNRLTLMTAIDDPMNGSVKCTSTPTHRRQSDAFTRPLVEQPFQPGASVAWIARDDDINAKRG